MALALACFFLGAWLGMRFKVAVLFPAVFAVFVLIWCVGLLGGRPYSLLIVAQIAAAVAIQVGYLTSALLNARFARHRIAAAMIVRDFG